MDFRAQAEDLWYRQLPGSMMLAMECDHLSHLLSHIFGDYLVQIGGPSNSSLIKSSPIASHAHAV